MQLSFGNQFWEAVAVPDDPDWRDAETHVGRKIEKIIDELQFLSLLPSFDTLEAYQRICAMTDIPVQRMCIWLYNDNGELGRPTPPSNAEVESLLRTFVQLLQDSILVSPSWKTAKVLEWEEGLQEAVESDRYEASLPDEELAELRKMEYRQHLLKLAEGDVARVEAAERYLQEHLEPSEEAEEQYFRILRGEA